MNGCEIGRSCEETVPILLVDEALLLMSNTLGSAGGEYAVVEATPSNATESSRSRSDGLCKRRSGRARGDHCSLPVKFILACGTFPVLCPSKGAGGRGADEVSWSVGWNLGSTHLHGFCQPRPPLGGSRPAVGTRHHNSKRCNPAAALPLLFFSPYLAILRNCHNYCASLVSCSVWLP